MDKEDVEDRHYNDEDFSLQPLPKGNYENCRFTTCSFNKADLRDISFIDCRFESCDFSNALLENTALRGVRFISCKMLGLHFEDCNEMFLEMGFEDCILGMSTFYKVSLQATVFERCDLRENDFTGADLSKAVFSDCDLLGARFESTTLLGSDLRTARNFSIDPENNRIRGACFSRANLDGLLGRYEIIIK